MAKSPAKAVTDAIVQKLQQQQEELDRRDVLLREEESTMVHLKKLKDDLTIATAQLARREDKLTATEARMMIAKAEESGLKSTQLDLERTAVKSVVNDILVSNYIKNVEQSIAEAMEALELRAQNVMELEGRMFEERRTLNDDQAKLTQQQADLEAHFVAERENLRRAKESNQRDQEKLAAAMAEGRSREEERDMYTKLIHDLEINDERARRHLKAIEDELDTRRLNLDIETDELRKNTAELQHQDNLYRTAIEQLAQDNAQLKAEKQNMAILVSRLNDREQSLNELAEELAKQEEKIRHDRAKLFREQQLMNDSIAENETIKREAEIDGIRNQAIATKTLQLKSEIDTANAQLEDREVYLGAWETELTNREEEFSRLVEQAISIPKLHQSSSEYQNVSSGVVKIQARRLKEHYLAGQQRRVFSASLKRGAGTTTGSDNAYRVALKSMGITPPSRSATTSVTPRRSESQSQQRNAAATNNNATPTTPILGSTINDDGYDDEIRVDDNGDSSGEDEAEQKKKGEIGGEADDDTYGSDGFDSPAESPAKDKQKAKQKTSSSRKRKQKASSRSSSARSNSNSPSATSRSASSSSSRSNASSNSSYKSAVGSDDDEEKQRSNSVASSSASPKVAKKDYAEDKKKNRTRSSSSAHSSSRSSSVDGLANKQNDDEEKAPSFEEPSAAVTPTATLAHQQQSKRVASGSGGGGGGASPPPPPTSASAAINRRMLLPPMSASSISAASRGPMMITTMNTNGGGNSTSGFGGASSSSAYTVGNGAAGGGSGNRFASAGSAKHTMDESLATSSRICSLSVTVNELQKAFRRYAARADLLVSDRNTEKVDRFYQRVTPSQRADIETAIWTERAAAQDIGIRRHFASCPVVAEKEFTTNPSEMVRKVTKWWLGVEESLQHSDERSLQERMELLDKAVDALSQALEKSEDIGQQGSGGGSERRRSSAAAASGDYNATNAAYDQPLPKRSAADGSGRPTELANAKSSSATSTSTFVRGGRVTSAGGNSGGNFAAATLSARRAMKHQQQQRPSTASATTASRGHSSTGNNRDKMSTSAMLL